MTAILDEKAIKRVSRETDLPKKNVALAVGGNRLFVIVVLLVLAHIAQTAFSWYAFSKAETNTELVYVKLYPDGTWDVTDFKPQDEQLYFKTTVDSLLETYLKARYGLMPETVRRDYSVAGAFMSSQLYSEFVSGQPGGFNAAQKVANIEANPKATDRIEIEWGFADHYDMFKGTFGKAQSDVMRTNLYFTMVTKTFSGTQKGEPVKMILKTQWRLVPKEELKQVKKKFLRINPIGLEIISQELIADPSGYRDSAEVETK